MIQGVLPRRLPLACKIPMAEASIGAVPRWGAMESIRALTRFLDDGNLSVDNNHLEGQIRPIAVGKPGLLAAVGPGNLKHRCV